MSAASSWAAACTSGNVTPAAEYNIWVDPEAARMVFHSGLPIEMVGWELGRLDATVSPAEIDEIRAIGTPLAAFAMESNLSAQEAFALQGGGGMMPLHDPTAMTIALDPSAALERSLHYVDIETQSELTRGMTVVDRFGVSGDERNAAVWVPVHQHGHKTAVCWSLDVPKWKSMLKAALR
ncbi:MAG: nucleoside hydrolase [Anaerolineae bacterium]